MEKKIWENVQCKLVLQLYPDFAALFFSFTSFNTTPLILLVKIISTQLKVTNSGGLMLVCRWTSVNDPVQNKFRSIIHLLSQHLLDQSHWRKHQMNVQDLLKVNNKEIRTKSMTSSGVLTLKGTLMQIWKFPYMLLFIKNNILKISHS